MNMKKITLLSLLIITTNLLFAQNCNLVVFSEGGESFYLILNGIKHNNIPETNVRVQGLKEAPYKAKIIFEDKKISPIEKNMYTVKDMENTYSIRRKKKDNSLIIKAVSQTPISEATVKKEVVATQTQPTTKNNSVTTTTHTTTTTSNNNNSNNGDGSFSMNVNINGSGMNVDIKDDMGGNVDMNVNDNTTYTETTTTTTTSGTVSSTPTKPVSNGRCDYPMTNSDFIDGKSSIESKTFADSKMTIAKQITKNNCPTAVQIRDYTKLFTFESGKLEYAKFAYDYCYDKGNYYKVNDAFEFESSIDELGEHTGN